MQKKKQLKMSRKRKDGWKSDVKEKMIWSEA